MRSGVRRWALVLGVSSFCFALSGVAEAASDFGSFVQTLLNARSVGEFGVVRPIEQSSARSSSAAQAQSDPLALVTLAPLLRARVVTSTPLALNIDMIALWPDDRQPTHLFACNEAEADDAGVIRVDLATGQT
ncbi:MAG TPA: hypothetical protein VFG86_21210, partial [Chloroflexota bacterium]|nr:hypothetical protein [Chloroflexota bacterium]